MQTADYVVLIAYFAVMAAIGIICMFKIKKQEDFFLGGRSFGKLMQTFAAFGAGTGSNDPVQVGSRTWGSGLAGIWSVLMWLFVTPFYWIFGVWYRRMRHITIGDWYVERYQSKWLGAAYAVFGIYFYMFYLSAMFTAIVKVAVPLIGKEQLLAMGITDPSMLKFYLIPAMGVLIVVYGILGGLKAAYWTDLIQGIGIIVLSIILIPYGLYELVKAFDPDGPRTMMRGLEIMHERTPSEYFQIFGGPRSSEFPLHYIVSLTLLGLVGIVVQPHFISTGGGSAKNENSARVGLVTGNFLKRFCTIGWALTGLILLTLMAGSVEIAEDPDQVWGVASRKILSEVAPGLVGLMLACLIAAMMSSADCYMIMVAGLVTRNFYTPMRPNGGEKEYLAVARVSGLIMIVGAGIISLLYQDVFAQFVSAITLPIIFAATFWVGMWWRRANKWSAWLTILSIVAVFFVLPSQLPDRLMPDLRYDQSLTIANDTVTTTISRTAKASDIARRDAWRAAYLKALDNEDAAKGLSALNTIKLPTVMPADAVEAHEAWVTRRGAVLGRLAKSIDALAKKKFDDDKARDEEARNAQANDLRQVAIGELKELGTPPPLLKEVVDADKIDLSTVDVKERFVSGGKPIFFAKLVPLNEANPGGTEPVDTTTEGNTEVVITRKTGQFIGEGDLKVELLIYHWLGMDLTDKPAALLTTLAMPPKLVLPFLLMFIFSLITPRTKKDVLDRYYTKMKVPVLPDAEADAKQLEEAYAHPEAFEDRKLFPGTSIEIQKPRWSDAVGFVLCFAVCFGIVWFAVWLTNLGSS